MRMVTRTEVEHAIAFAKEYAARAHIPPSKDDLPDEAAREAAFNGTVHTDFVIGYVLPLLHLPAWLLRIAVEAYLSGMEADSDGSSVVPESLRYGYIKDWQGVMHDYIYWLHARALPDAFGHVWGWNEANNAYRLGWIYDGQRGRAYTWYLGLTIGSYPVWCGWVR